MKAKITIYLWMNIIRQLPNSSIIVDASNPENVIGNNINDAISYFSNDNNKGIVAEWNWSSTPVLAGAAIHDKVALRVTHRNRATNTANNI